MKVITKSDEMIAHALLQQSEFMFQWDTISEENKLSLEVTRKAIGRAFAGNEKVAGEPVLQWLLRGPYTHIPENERVDTSAFLMGFPIEQYARKNSGTIAFGHRTQTDDQGHTKSLPGSTLVFFAYDPAKDSKNRNMWQNIKNYINDMRTYWKLTRLGPVPSLFDGKSNRRGRDLVFQRASELEPQMNRFHSQYGPKEKHWYVACVGVDPDNQGKGYGKQLMKQMSDIADATGRACYLECATDKNRAFYERCGYKVVGTDKLCTSDAPNEHLDVFFMLRPPAMKQ